MADKDDLEQLRVDAEAAALQRLIEACEHSPAAHVRDMAEAAVLLRTASRVGRSGKVNVL